MIFFPVKNEVKKNERTKTKKLKWLMILILNKLKYQIKKNQIGHKKVR